MPVASLLAVQADAVAAVGCATRADAAALLALARGDAPLPAAMEVAGLWGEPWLMSELQVRVGVATTHLVLTAM